MKTADQTRLAAGRVLTIGAQSLSASLDSFSGWLLAGFGATFGLILTNLDTAAQFVALGSLKLGAVLFLVAAALAVSQKMLAAFVASGATSAEAARKFGRELAESGADIDVDEMYRQVADSLYWPWSALARRSVKKSDYASAGRSHASASQIQSVLVYLQALLSIAAALVVVSGITI